MARKRLTDAERAARRSGNIGGISRRQREHEKQLERDRRYREKLKEESTRLKVTRNEMQSIRKARRAQAKISDKREREIATSMGGLANFKDRMRRYYSEMKDRVALSEHGTSLGVRAYDLQAQLPRSEFQSLFTKLINARHNQKSFVRYLHAFGLTQIGEAAAERYRHTIIAVIDYE